MLKFNKRVSVIQHACHKMSRWFHKQLPKKLRSPYRHRRIMCERAMELNAKREYEE